MGGKKVHNSKQDAWLILLVMGLGGFLAFKLLTTLAYGGDRGMAAALFWTCAFYWSVIFLIGWPAKYVIHEKTLTVRAGVLLCMPIHIPSIKRIGPTRSMMSAPAWSMDRLRIEFWAEGKAGVVLVSPENKELFIRHLLEVNPRIELLGGQKDNPQPAASA